MNIDMKAIGKLQTAADVAFAAWKGPGSYALKNHTGYAAALKANDAAAAAYEALRAYVQDAYDSLPHDMGTPWGPIKTDQGWYPKLGAIIDGAIQQLNFLASVRGQIIADMMAHMSLLNPSDQAKVSSQVHTNPLGAAGLVDAAKPNTTGNPNADNPGSQSTDAPPVDAPPGAETPWGMIAIGAAVGALVLKLVWR